MQYVAIMMYVHQWIEITAMFQIVQQLRFAFTSYNTWKMHEL